ncbi:pyridoxamine 5'-phosphate oxidase family protein [Christensenellaceae bacterium OttesenSCG-928-K19]|nr:pyridoxamine 5'-phosphate oxidase family protein [Christensenellaceae bacterium OttesenSCG-928-K19]
MDQLQKFWDSVKNEDTAILATSANNNVTMRTISPVYYKDAILIFTSPESQKYKQLKENSACCVAIGGCFLEANAELLGPTMQNKNTHLRDVYTKKFNDAFDETVEHGGCESDFVLLNPLRITGWVFESGMPTSPLEYTF